MMEGETAGNQAIVFKSQGNAPPAGEIDERDPPEAKRFSVRCTDRGKLMMKGKYYYRTRCTARQQTCTAEV